MRPKIVAINSWFFLHVWNCSSRSPDPTFWGREATDLQLENNVTLVKKNKRTQLLIINIIYNVPRHNHVIRDANLCFSLTLWTLMSIYLCLWFYLKSKSKQQPFYPFFWISTDSWWSFINIIAHLNAIYSVINKPV